MDDDEYILYFNYDKLNNEDKQYFINNISHMRCLTDEYLKFIHKHGIIIDSKTASYIDISHLTDYELFIDYINEYNLRSSFTYNIKNIVLPNNIRFHLSTFLFETYGRFDFIYAYKMENLFREYVLNNIVLILKLIRDSRAKYNYLDKLLPDIKLNEKVDWWDVINTESLNIAIVKLLYRNNQLSNNDINNIFAYVYRDSEYYIEEMKQFVKENNIKLTKIIIRYLDTLDFKYMAWIIENTNIDCVDEFYSILVNSKGGVGYVIDIESVLEYLIMNNKISTNIEELPNELVRFKHNIQNILNMKTKNKSARSTIHSYFFFELKFSKY